MDIVLRISVPTNDGIQLFILEGRLTGDWVGELLRVTRELLPGTNCIFDIEDVLFVDVLGERALLWLDHIGAAFIVRNAYGVDLCERLNLRLVTGETYPGQGRARKHRSANTQPDNR